MKRRNVEIEVSDHAILRWLEREHALDIATVRRHLAGLASDAAALGAIAVKVGEVRLTLQQHQSRSGTIVVVTALPRNSSGQTHAQFGKLEPKEHD